MSSILLQFKFLYCHSSNHPKWPCSLQLHSVNLVTVTELLHSISKTFHPLFFSLQALSCLKSLSKSFKLSFLLFMFMFLLSQENNDEMSKKSPKCCFIYRLMKPCIRLNPIFSSRYCYAFSS